MASFIPSGEDRSTPLPAFNFHVRFAPRTGSSFAALAGTDPIVAGGFSEISGLEATMEAKTIKEGGRNYGTAQRAGAVTFATVVLKRGVVESRHLWSWWSIFAGGDGRPNGEWTKSSRCDVVISLIRPRKKGDPADAAPAGARAPVLGWRLENAMPVKFRVGDLNARATDVAIEELHLVHEGLHMETIG